uniref:hypothetical protein n=1 Tax=Candidatus Electrothrix sp. TaxID=2170559 RepID=UPI00405708D3
MNSRYKKYTVSALFLMVSSQAFNAGSQELNQAGGSSTSDLPMAKVIYTDQIQNLEPTMYQNQNLAPPPVVMSAETEVGREQEEVTSDGRVFGYRYGKFHASLGGGWQSTDNLYNDDGEKIESFQASISPTVWYTWPRRSSRPLQVAADNTPVGGLQYSPTEYDIYNKFNLYFGGKLTYTTYSANSDLNNTQGGLQAQINYKHNDRLSLSLMDNYSRGQDIFNVAEATSENNRVYDSNVVQANAKWHVTDKIYAGLGYSNHLLLYELDLNNFMDRADHGFNGTLGYTYSPKTNFFMSMSHFMAAYDEDEMPDNANIIVRAGINWQATVKTGFMLGAGYQMVDYDEDWKSDGAEAVVDTLKDGQESFNYEIQGTWQATRKNQFLLNSTYNIEQSDSQYALNKTVWTSRLGYSYRFTSRIKATMDFIYEESDYAQFDGASRFDERWNFSPSLSFALRKWLSLSLSYGFDKKDSNFCALPI